MVLDLHLWLALLLLWFWFFCSHLKPFYSKQYGYHLLPLVTANGDSPVYPSFCFFYFNCSFMWGLLYNLLSPLPLLSLTFPIAPPRRKGKNPAWVMMKMLLFNRPDANQGNLRSAAYEALMELIKNSAKVSRIVKKKKIHVERGFMTLGGEGSIIIQLNCHSSSFCYISSYCGIISGETIKAEANIAVRWYISKSKESKCNKNVRTWLTCWLLVYINFILIM